MAGVAKLFKVSNDINEIKDILREMQRDSRPIAPPSGAYRAAGYTAESHESPVALMRAVNAEAGRMTFEGSPTLQEP